MNIDNISLKAIFEHDVVRGADEELARRIVGKVNENGEMRPLLSDGLSAVGISTAKQLVEKLEQHRGLLLHQAATRFRAKGWRIVNRGTSVLQLVYVIAALQKGPQGIIDVMEIMGHEPRPEFAQEVMQQIQKARGQGA